MRNKKRRSLTLHGREIMIAMKVQGSGIREIGRYLGKDASIVSRELRRNCPPLRLRLSEMERARWANDRAKERLKARKRGKRGGIKLLKVREYVVDRLIDKKSPEAIAGVMESEIGAKVSYSTIYRWVKNDVPELKKYLYEKGKKRRQRVMDRRGRFQQAAVAKRSYEQRPLQANDRSEVGHLEGDTIHGCKGTSAAVLSIRDRKTRLHLFDKVENLEAETVTRVLVRLLHKVPAQFRKTLTFDRGSEFADWPMIEKIFPDLIIYFCDPYCPHQKGSNERGNRDFRKYHPKGTDFDRVTAEQVRAVQVKVNQHPMKLHGWRTPQQVYNGYIEALAA